MNNDVAFGRAIFSMQVTEMGFKTATADGAYDLDLESYKLLFSNFLLGKTIYGPGNDHLFENGS